jgi:hypothetical protein
MVPDEMIGDRARAIRTPANGQEATTDEPPLRIERQEPRLDL